MSLYKEYMSEVFGAEVIEHDKGFASFKIMGHEIYIQDIFIHRDFRGSENGLLAVELADKVAEIGKKSGCKFLIGSCSFENERATDSMKSMLGYGFQFVGVDAGKRLLYFKKEIL